MAKGFFITGTDTGVGKTIVAAALLKTISYLGHKACAMKPIESGCSPEGDILIPDDGMFLKKFAKMEEPLRLVTPCCFESPLAPLPASERDKTKVNFTDINKAFEKLGKIYPVIVVEGLGGLMVPIKKDYFVMHLAQDLGLPLIVVARPGLGTLNHIMLTVNMAMNEGLEVAGIILNYCHPPEGNAAEDTNPGVLEKICPVPIIGILPYLKSVDPESIEKAALKNLSLEILKQYLN